MDLTKDKFTPIKTFVFLDIESTHLESLDKPKMMEICLVAVHRSELLETCLQYKKSTPLKETQQPKVLTPRVSDSLSLCMNPGKAVSPAALQITGLDNLNLSESSKPRFGETDATMLKLFLARQEGPVCLLAHNGFKFDFPLIRAELDKINSSLPSGILCGDTLCAFREMDGQNPTTPLVAGRRKIISNEATNLVLDKQDKTKNVARNLFPAGSELEKDNQGSAKMLRLTQNQLSREEEVLQNSYNPNVSLPGGSRPSLAAAHRCVNGSHCGGNCCKESSHSGHDSIALCKTSTAESFDGSSVSNNATSYLHNLTVNVNEGASISKPSLVQSKNSSNLLYGLGEIYRRTFHEYPTDAHQAMSDVMALISVFIPGGKSLIEYFDVNAIPFQEVAPYYTSTPSVRKRALATGHELKENEHERGSGRMAQNNDMPSYGQLKKQRM